MAHTRVFGNTHRHSAAFSKTLRFMCNSNEGLPLIMGPWGLLVPVMLTLNDSLDSRNICPYRLARRVNTDRYPATLLARVHSVTAFIYFGTLRTPGYLCPGSPRSAQIIKRRREELKARCDASNRTPEQSNNLPPTSTPK